MFKKTKRDRVWANVSDLKKEKQTYLGRHLIIEFWGAKIIENPKELESLLISAAFKSNNTPLAVKIHKFNPQGITGIILLSESHISCHSWPEYDYLALDIFSCGAKTFPEKAFLFLKKELKPQKISVLEIKRGLVKSHKLILNRKWKIN